MNETETYDIMQSDMKLWEAAAKAPTQNGNAMLLTLELPWGIGKTEITLEGLASAEGKRNAVGVYGQLIRDLIADRTADEAVTARSKLAAAASSEAADSRDGGHGAAEGGGEEIPRAEAGRAHGEIFIPTGETVDLRIDELQGAIREDEDRLASHRRELRGLIAFKEAMNYAPTIQDTPTTGTEGEEK
jgi:hypothetical protein